MSRRRADLARAHQIAEAVRAKEYVSWEEARWARRVIDQEANRMLGWGLLALFVTLLVVMVWLWP